MSGGELVKEVEELNKNTPDIMLKENVQVGLKCWLFYTDFLMALHQVSRQQPRRFLRD